MKHKTILMWLSIGLITTVVVLILIAIEGEDASTQPDRTQMKAVDTGDKTEPINISHEFGSIVDSRQSLTQAPIDTQTVSQKTSRSNASSPSTRIVSNVDKHKLGMPGSEAVALMQDLYYKLDDEKASREERLELLKKMELAIRAGLVHPNEYDEALRFVASGNYWSGDVDHALDLGRELMENATDEAIAVSSAQLVGMIEGFDHNNPEASVEAYQRSLEMIEASESWDSHQMQARYVEALGKIAYGYERSGDFERSVEYRKRVLSLNSIGARVWINAHRHVHEEKLAQALAQLGRHDEASTWYARLLRNYPDLGRDDGSIVIIIWNQINALGLSELSPDRLDRLWALFNDESMARYHQIAGIGNVIAQIYLKRDGLSSASEDVERAWGALWHKCKGLLNNQTLMADSFARDQVMANATTALFELGTAQSRNKDYGAAIETFREFLYRFPDHGLAVPAQNYLDLYLSIPGQ